VRSAYEILASICGTKPIHIRFGANEFVFSWGPSQYRLKPLAWFDVTNPSSHKIVGIDDQPSVPNVVAVHVIRDAIPAAQRQSALEAVLAGGMKKLRNPARFAAQRPEVIFENDEVLAVAFDHQQRQALAKAVWWSPACRFQALGNESEAIQPLPSARAARSLR